MPKTKIVTSLLSIAGETRWIYGYVAAGAPPMIDWSARAPWWIADFMPNKQAEINTALICLAQLPTYWPGRPE